LEIKVLNIIDARCNHENFLLITEEANNIRRKEKEAKRKYSQKAD